MADNPAACVARERDRPKLPRKTGPARLSARVLCLPAVTRRPPHSPTALSESDRRTLDQVARAHVCLVLDACRNNRTHAARILGVDRKTLVRSLKRWGITASAEPAQLPPGSLIALEGIDGAGLTTQARRLVDHLNAHGHAAIYTDEPSRGPIGQLVRGLLAQPGALAHPGALRTYSLLFAADRVDHFHRVVAPALAAGTTVVSDRWYHSSLAYQRTGIEREWIMQLNRHARPPDLTVVLDVAPETGARRRAAAGRPAEYFHDPEIQRDLAGGYRATIVELRAAGERIDVVDGEQPEDAVAAEILRAIGERRRRR